MSGKLISPLFEPGNLCCEIGVALLEFGLALLEMRGPCLEPGDGLAKLSEVISRAIYGADQLFFASQQAERV
jgi:hypothetical protein